MMKKLTAILLTMALLLTGAAFAEEEEYPPMPAEAGVFDGFWKCGDMNLTMDWEEEGFRVDISLTEDDQKTAEWEYSGFFNAEDCSVVSMPTGRRTNYTYDDAGNEACSIAYEDGEATFTIDTEGRLRWQDAKEDAGKDLAFVKIGTRQFEGVWACGRASMEVVFEEEGYRVFISWGSSAAEHTEWEYSCLYNAENNTLEAMPFGICTDIVMDEKGKVVSSNVRYEDGEAAFVLDADGHLLWQDAKEDAGNGMAFEWVEMIDISSEG